MKFDLHRPCKDCPFRTDCLEDWLGRSRAQEIAESITLRDEPFPCHKTTDVDDEGDGIRTPDSDHCAGALILLEKAGHGPGQLARIAMRLGMFDPTRLDMEAPVFDSVGEFVQHHASADEIGETCSVVDAGCEAPAGYATAGGAIVNHVEPGITTACADCGEHVCGSCCEQGEDGGRTCNRCVEMNREWSDDDD